MGEADENIRDTHIISPECTERFLPLQQDAGRPLKNLDISLAGISSLRGSYKIGRVRPNWHVLLFTIAGKGRLRTESGVAALVPGTVVFLPRHTTHEYQLEDRWDILWFHLRPMETWRHLESKSWSISQAGYLHLLTNSFHGFLRETQHHDEESQRAGELHAHLIALYLKRELNYAHTASEWELREKLRALWNQVDETLQANWTIPLMARKVHMSSGHFHRLVQEIYGQTPMEKLTALRMQHAHSLLISTNFPAYKVAEQVGYTNPYAFSTACKRHFGKSPRALRADEESSEANTASHWHSPRQKNTASS